VVKLGKLYPESHVEIDGFIARHYEGLLNLITLGKYGTFIEDAVRDMKIEPEDRIIDLGAGSGYNAQFMSEYLGQEGEILGLDISREGIAQFREKFANNPDINIENKRIDVSLPYDSRFDKALTSFVIHGLPHPSREELLKNAHKALKQGGVFYVLDYGEFELSDLPVYLRIPFRVAECDYAYDYLSRDWKEILEDFGFSRVKTSEYLGGFTRLLSAEKG
jgi:demethylmenaquinone methyltransferase/2-methoxy-6-polyprenyl-1,4-benzoquinol methylase